MVNLTSQHITNHLLLAKSAIVVRSSPSATSSLIRNVGAGGSAGTPTGKICISGENYWIEVMQIPYNTGFVKSSEVKILNPKKQEVFLTIDKTSSNAYTITLAMTSNLSETQAKSELDKFILNEQAVFSSLGRSQALLKKIPSTVNVSTQKTSINALTERYNKRRQKLSSIKALKTASANHNSFFVVPVSGSPIPPIQLYGMGALPAVLIVPIVKWTIVGITALALWLMIRSNKSEGLSDLKLSRDIETILSQKLSETERKKVISEFEQQRKQAFSQGQKAAGGTIGKVTSFLKWGAIGVGVALIAKKVFFNTKKNDTL